MESVASTAEESCLSISFLSFEPVANRPDCPHRLRRLQSQTKVEQSVDCEGTYLVVEKGQYRRPRLKAWITVENYSSWTKAVLILRGSGPLSLIPTRFIRDFLRQRPDSVFLTAALTIEFGRSNSSAVPRFAFAAYCSAPSTAISEMALDCRKFAIHPSRGRDLRSDCKYSRGTHSADPHH